MVERLAAEAGVRVEVRDVDADGEQGAADREQWSDHVPVVLLDGVRHSMWFVDESLLAKALRGR